MFQAMCVATWLVMPNKLNVRIPLAIDFSYYGNEACVPNCLVHDGISLPEGPNGERLTTFNLARESGKLLDASRQQYERVCGQ